MNYAIYDRKTEVSVDKSALRKEHDLEMNDVSKKASACYWGHLSFSAFSYRLVLIAPGPLV